MVQIKRLWEQLQGLRPRPRPPHCLLHVDEVLQALLHAHQLAVVNRVGGVDQGDLLLVHFADIKVLGKVSEKLILKAPWYPRTSASGRKGVPGNQRVWVPQQRVGWCLAPPGGLGSCDVPASLGPVPSWAGA